MIHLLFAAGTAQLAANTGSGTLNLVTGQAGINQLTVTVSATASGVTASDTQTSTVSGSIISSFDANPTTGATTAMTLTGGDIAMANMDFVLQARILFINIDVANISTANMGGKAYTPPPIPSPVTATVSGGSFDATLHRLLINRGTLTGANTYDDPDTPINEDFAASPIEGAGTGTGTVTMVPGTADATHRTMQATIQMPVDFTETQNMSGTPVTIRVQGTIKASGPVRIPLAAPISVVNTGSSVLLDTPGTVMETTPRSISFDAGATADAIILSLSSESNATAGQVSIRYAGFPFTPVIDHSGSQPSVWLLNLGHTTYTGGTAALVLDMTGVNVVNGYGLGIVSVKTNNALLDGLGVHASNTSTATSVGLTTTLESFAIAGHYVNLDSGGATAPSPMTQLYGAQIGSARGAAGYQADMATGTSSFSFGSTSGTAGPRSSAAAFVPVSLAPVLLSKVPADNATEVPLAANLVATFSEPVVAGTGNIELWQTGGGLPLEAFNVATSPRLTFSSATLTIDPTSSLKPGVEYHIRIASTAVVGTDGNAFAGISDPMAWNFTADNTGAIFVKANNANHLALGSSWVGDGVPTSTDRAKWDSTVTSSNTTSLGADLTFGGIVIANPTGPVTINPGNTLSLGAGLVDIDLSAATQDLNLNCALSMGAPNTWDVTSGRTLALGGVVSGSAGVTKQGAGTAILSSANTYTGGTVITAGTLKLSGSGTLGAAGASVALSSGALLDLNGTHQSIAFTAGTGVGTVANNSGSGTSTLTLSASPAATVIITDNTNSSNGKIAVVVPVNCSGLGASNTYSGGTTVNAGAFLYNNPGGSGTGTITLTALGANGAESSGLVVNGGIYANDLTGAGYVHNNTSSGTSVTTFTGNINTSGPFIFRAGTGIVYKFAGDGTSSSLSGVIGSTTSMVNGAVATGSVIKSGTGTLTLSGNNLYTGSTTVSGGTLALHGGSQKSPITVQTGATLGFDIAAPNTSTKAVTLDAGHKISVSGSPTLPAYTLMTTSSTITGAAPNLDPAIPGYNLMVDGGNTLKLIAAPTNTYASWISKAEYGLAVADQDLGDDPDGDGIENGVENFFGSNPGVFNSGLVAVSASGGIFTFTHPQNAIPASDLTATYRWSTDLASFNLGGATIGGTTVTFTTQANTPSPGFTRVTATATGTLPDRLFVDVRVTGP